MRASRSTTRRGVALLLVVSTVLSLACTGDQPDRVVGVPLGIVRQRDKGEPVELLNTEFGVYRSIDVPNGYFAIRSNVQSTFLLLSNIDRPSTRIISINIETGKLVTLDLPEREEGETSRAYFMANHAIEVRDDDVTIVNLSDGVSGSISRTLGIDEFTVTGSELRYDDEVLVVRAEPSDVVVPFNDPTNAWVVGGRILAINGDRVVADLNAPFAELALVERGGIVGTRTLDDYPQAMSVDSAGRARALTVGGTIIEWDFANDQPERLVATWEKTPTEAHFVGDGRIVADTNGKFRLVDLNGAVVAELTGFELRGVSGGCFELSGHVYDVETGRQIGSARELEEVGPCTYRSYDPESTVRNVVIAGGRSFDVAFGVVLDVSKTGSAFIARDEQLKVTLTDLANGTVRQIGDGYGTHLFVG
jgi:hypothetical protein